MPHMLGCRKGTVLNEHPAKLLDVSIEGIGIRRMAFAKDETPKTGEVINVWWFPKGQCWMRDVNDTRISG